MAPGSRGRGGRRRLEDVGHLPHFAAPQAVLDTVAEAWETAALHV